LDKLGIRCHAWHGHDYWIERILLLKQKGTHHANNMKKNFSQLGISPILLECDIEEGAGLFDIRLL
jgi:hypothetical protein